LWQKVFDDPIARPPLVDGSQAVLVERADPDPRSMKDIALIVDVQSGAVQWKIVDAKQPIPFVSRQVEGVKASQKYWLFFIRYLKPEGMPNPPALQYELVVDKQSGHVVYDSGPNMTGSAMTTAISDEALFDNYGSEPGVFAYEYMRRVDLSFGAVRWMHVWDSRGTSEMFAVNGSLYVFADNIERYDLMDGKLTASTNFDLRPILGDLILKDQWVIMRSEDFMSPQKEGVDIFDMQSFSPLWHAHVDFLPDKGSNAFWGNIPSMTVTPDSIYLFDKQDTLLRLDLQTGKQNWQAPSPGPQAMSRPVAASGLVYGFFADGTVRAFSEADGTQLGIAMKVPLWYLTRTDTREWRDLVGGLGVSGDTLIVTTGCRSVYAIQRAQ
jgi:hypothetical protein